MKNLMSRVAAIMLALCICLSPSAAMAASLDVVSDDGHILVGVQGGDDLSVNAQPVMVAEDGSAYGPSEDTEIPVWTDSVKAQAQKIMEQMTDDEKIGQLFILKRGPNMSAGDSMLGWVAEYKPAGFLFTSDDWGAGKSAADVTAYVNKFQNESRVPLIAAVDQEGGTVCRLVKTPSQLELAEGGADAVYQDGVNKAGLLASYGMNLNFAPVADVAKDGSFIYNRTYGRDASGTVALIQQAVDGLESNGMGSCLKHFPGYGDAVDSHTGSGTEYAESDRSLSKLLSEDLIPFKAGRSAGSQMVMVGHVIYPELSGSLSASVSPAVYQMLRENLGQDCVAVTDSLSMKVKMSDGDEDGMQCLRALQAGADLVMTKYPEKQYPVVVQAIKDKSLSMDRVEESCLRVLCWKIQHGIVDPAGLDVSVKTGVYDQKTLSAALSAAKNDPSDTVRIVVTGDFTIDASKTVDKITVPANKRIILDLDGHKIDAFPDDASFAVKNKAVPFSLTANTQFAIWNGTVSGSCSKRSMITVTKPNVSVEFKNCTFEGFDNTADKSNSHNGSIVFAGDGSNNFKLDILDGCVFKDIVTESSGAIYVKCEGSRVRILDSTFTRCVAWRNGGAIMMEAGTLCVSGSTFDDCRTEPKVGVAGITNTEEPYGRGGAICVASVESDKTFDMGAVWTGVKEQSGPDWFADVGSDAIGVCVTGGTRFNGCSASVGNGKVNSKNGHGGAIWSASPVNVLSDVVFEGNKSTGNGGAVYVGRDDPQSTKGSFGNLFLTDCIVKKNESSNYNTATGSRVSQTRYGGGGVFCGGNLYMAGTEISDNVAQGSGGGVLWQDDSSKIFRMYDCSILRNTAEKGEGGGLFLGCGDDHGTGDAEIVKVKILDNNTNTTSGWGGGGIFVRHDAKLTIGNAIIIDNRAEGMGGGIAGCPTSDMAVMLSLSAAAALSGNYAGGKFVESNVAYLYKLPDGAGEYGRDFFCLNNSIVEGGAWSKGWMASDRTLPDSRVEFDVKVSPIECSEKGWLALTSALNPEDHVITDDDAVIISGNYSKNNGGGIGCNGVVFVTMSGIESGFEMPKTGSVGTMPVLVSGGTLVLIAGLVLILKRRRIV